MTKVWVRPQLFPAYICPQNNIPKLWGGVEGTLPDCYPLYFIQWAFSHLKLGTRWAQSQQHCSEPTAQRQQDEMIKANGVTQPPHAWTSHPSPQPALWPHQMLTKGVRREEQSPKAACQPAPHQTKAQKQFYPCPLGLRLYFKKTWAPKFPPSGGRAVPTSYSSYLKCSELRLLFETLLSSTKALSSSAPHTPGAICLGRQHCPS